MWTSNGEGIRAALQFIQDHALEASHSAGEAAKNPSRSSAAGDGMQDGIGRRSRRAACSRQCVVG